MTGSELHIKIVTFVYLVMKVATTARHQLKLSLDSTNKHSGIFLAANLQSIYLVSINHGTFYFALLLLATNINLILRFMMKLFK